ncbi:MAG: septum formation initiator family protein [Candidatus Contendobacter sp.]|nr:septum formation initiator family protein [Candidatus Contendobacter sp.]MDG4558590.1 septum formation initiator family protein [Candidatus Contendobacter sp.]
MYSVAAPPMAHFPEQGFKLQLLAVGLIAALVFLHYLLWIDEDGVRQTHTLRISIRAQTEENAELAERNHALTAEIEDLKRGSMAIEERARADMGMIRPDETFYRFLDKPLPPAATPPHKPTPAATPPASAAKPMAPAKPPTPAAKPMAPAKPPTPAAKPPAPAARPAPAVPGASPRRD